MKKKLKIILPIVLVLALGIAAGVIVSISMKKNKPQKVESREMNLFVDGQVEFKENGKWGMRTKDKVVIKPQYDSVSNKTFFETISGSYTENQKCQKYYKKIRYRFKQGDKLGYLDKNGKIIIGAKYDGTICLDGIIQAYKTERGFKAKEGIIDENDNVIVDFKYSEVGYDNTSKIYWGSQWNDKNKESKYFYFDSKGKGKTITKDYECCSPVVNGLIAIRDKKTKKEGLMKIDGKVICKPKYGEIMIEKLSENKIPFKDKTDDTEGLDFKQGKVGYLNTKGEVVIEPQYNDGFGFDTSMYSEQYCFKNDRAIVHPNTWYSESDKDYAHPENNLSLTQNIGTGVVDGKGNYIIQPKYEKIIRLKNGNYYFEGDGNSDDCYGFFTKDGKLIRENNIHKDDYSLTDYIDNDRQIVCKTIESSNSKNDKTKYGIIDEKGKLLTKIDYDAIGPIFGSDDSDQDFVHHDIVVARKGDRYGYVNAKTGKEITKFEYLGASRFYDDGYAVIINKEKKAEIIDTNFKTIMTGDGFDDKDYEFYKRSLKINNQ